MKSRLWLILMRGDAIYECEMRVGVNRKNVKKKEKEGTIMRKRKKMKKR